MITKTANGETARSEWCFIIGSAMVGLFSLGCGFIHGPIPLFILRGFTGMQQIRTYVSLHVLTHTAQVLERR